MLNGLENLTHLDLPPSHALRLGFDGGSGCGNAYFGKGGRAYGRQVSKKAAKATEKGGKIVIANLPHLTSFTIGGRKANVTRIEGEIVNATWPWTGRMEEWVMEEWPEPEVGSYDSGDVEYDSM